MIRHHPRCAEELAKQGKTARDVQHGWPNGCGYGDLIWSNKYAAWIPWPFNCNISDGGGCYVHCSIGVPDVNICEQAINAFMRRYVNGTAVVKATDRILVKVPDVYDRDEAVQAIEGGPAREPVVVDPTRPLGIADVVKAVQDEEHPGWPALPEHWYWCRVHEQAVKVSELCKASATPPSYKVDGFWDAADHMVGTTWEMEYPLETCIRQGPFMSEREAKRLGRDMIACPECKTALGYSPLGVEVER